MLKTPVPPFKVATTHKINLHRRAGRHSADALTRGSVMKRGTWHPFGSASEQSGIYCGLLVDLDSKGRVLQR